MKRDRRLWLATAALHVCLVWLYWPSLSFAPSALDDRTQLLHAAEPSASAWARDSFGHVRPLKNLLFMRLARAGDDLGAWRAGLLCVFLLTVGLVQRWAARCAGSAAVGLAAAACWALNPTTASVVCWLSAANIALCAAAVLLYVELGRRVLLAKDPLARRWALVACALLALGFALACHQLAVLAPLLLLVHQRVELRRRGGRDAAAIYAGSLACLAGYLALQLLSDGAGPAYRAAVAPAWLLAASAARYFALNLVLWLWPWGSFGVLLVDAPAEHALANALAWLALLAAAVLAWRLGRRDRAIALGLAWLVLFLLPLCNLIPLGNTPVAMHYLYLPAIGLALALARAAGLVLARAIARERIRTAVASVLMLAVAATWLPASRRAALSWGDEEQLYARTHANHPGNVEVLVNLGSLYMDRGDRARAQRAFDAARRLAPADVGVLRLQYALLWEAGQLQAALAVTEAQALHDLPEFAIRRGELLERLGRYPEAHAAFERAFARTADRQERLIAGYRLAASLLRSEQRARAAALVDRLLAEYPGQPQLLEARRLIALSQPRPQ